MTPAEGRVIKVRWTRAFYREQVRHYNICLAVVITIGLTLSIGLVISLFFIPASYLKLGLFAALIGCNFLWLHNTEKILKAKRRINNQYIMDNII